MKVQRRTLLAVGGAVVLAVAIAGVVRFALDNDADDAAQPAVEANTGSTGTGGSAPVAASAAAQQQAHEGALQTWTPSAIREAFENSESRTAGSAAPSSSQPKPGGSAAGSESPGPAVAPSSPKAAGIACKEPRKPLAPPAGLTYTRFCYSGKLNVPPSKEIGVLFYNLGAKHSPHVCTATVANTSDGNGFAGNGSVLATAGHCFGLAPGGVDESDGDKPVKAWMTHTNFVFVPYGHVKTLYKKLDDPNVTQAAFSAWLDKVAWFGKVGTNTEQVGFAPLNYMNAGVQSMDFATLIVAPKNGKTILSALGGVGADMQAAAAGKRIVSWGYPAGTPFTGDQLFVCTGKSRTYGNQVAANNAEVVIGCDMTGGSSGGPWFVQDGGLQLVSVNSHGPPNIMVGPNLNRDHWVSWLCGREFGVAPPSGGPLCKLGKVNR
jgi:hypothetical protein